MFYKRNYRFVREGLYLSWNEGNLYGYDLHVFKPHEGRMEQDGAQTLALLLLTTLKGTLNADLIDINLNTGCTGLIIIVRDKTPDVLWNTVRSAALRIMSWDTTVPLRTKRDCLNVEAEDLPKAKEYAEKIFLSLKSNFLGKAVHYNV